MVNLQHTDSLHAWTGKLSHLCNKQLSQLIYSMYAAVFTTKYFFYTSIIFLYSLLHTLNKTYVRVNFASDYFGLYGIYKKIDKNNFCKEFFVLYLKVNIYGYTSQKLLWRELFKLWRVMLTGGNGEIRGFIKRDHVKKKKKKCCEVGP